ncbi:MAG: preprotein translocase subunit SecE [Gemmataceae bacterium]|nr:preprotein translocase subunit SecE [Gemmataceae bacterium]
MSVVEKEVAVPTERTQRQSLALASMLGAVYVLFCLWFVLGGLPLLWDILVPINNEFLSGALLLIATIAVATGLWYVGYRLEKTHAQPGLRAGVFFAAVLIYLVAWLSKVVGNFLEGRELETAGVVITLLVFGGLAYLAYRILTGANFADWLVRVENKGWFHALPYKPTQGVRVRRGTVIAILIVGAAGLITMMSQRRFGSDRLAPNNWEWTIPFTYNPDTEAMLTLPLMFKVHLVLPILLGAVIVWFAWRVVNLPAFADFLIATEAEINKVSWTSRKRLVQDTIVVLVTVFLLTAFLFFIDILWIKVLSWKPIGVLQVDIKLEQQKQQEKTQW